MLNFLLPKIFLGKSLTDGNRFDIGFGDIFADRGQSTWGAWWLFSWLQIFGNPTNSSWVLRHCRWTHDFARREPAGQVRWLRWVTGQVVEAIQHSWMILDGIQIPQQFTHTHTFIYIYIYMHAIRKSIYIFLLGMWCHGHEPAIELNCHSG